MISSLIVLSTVLLAGIFSLAYALSPTLRQQVEAPKHVFLQQLAQYDQSLQENRKQARG